MLYVPVSQLKTRKSDMGLDIFSRQRDIKKKRMENLIGVMMTENRC